MMLTLVVFLNRKARRLRRRANNFLLTDTREVLPDDFRLLR